ncbi:hypothetical protein KPL76_13295 [Subtercola sp. PAMC28395]|nr:hypothetical protein [Subtercola sp. PAMC28395]QWT23659.1 hypothetical protein KPL76_13295 [Subtercola sp. PAMC28395]
MTRAIVPFNSNSRMEFIIAGRGGVVDRTSPGGRERDSIERRIDLPEHDG